MTWRRFLAAWCLECSDRRNALYVGNRILDYLAEHPAVTRSPQEFCSRRYRNPFPLSAWLDRGQSSFPVLNNAVHRFFAWFLEQHLSAKDDFGRAFPSPDHFNPITRLSVDRPSETVRQALPTHLLRELLRILVEDDWAWPRAQKADWVEVPTPAGGETKKMWCPVRAVALALKLVLPLRTFQVRVLESGEGDTEWYENGGWVPNVSSHRPTTSKVIRRGFLRKIDNPGGPPLTGFFVNTNKTADRIAGGVEAGYVIPWQHGEAIAIVEMLERWQRTFNPVEGPIAWSSLHDSVIQLSRPRSGGAFFLMRDPGGTFRNEPVGSDRIARLWDNLLIELEMRLAKRGERLGDGSPIKLTRLSKKKGRNPIQRAAYGLHSLRVSIITALATQGELPLHLLSKLVAGHASVVMTLYYCKTDPVTLQRQLTEASARVNEAGQQEFAAYLGSAHRVPEAVVAEPSGWDALKVGRSASWLMLETGVCPVGGTLCHKGGPLIAANKHGPVPGKRMNCARCRFHLTGPAFLPALVVRFNAASMHERMARLERDAAERAVEEAENAELAAQQAGQRTGGVAMAQARSRRERAEAALNLQVEDMQAVYQLVERCRAVLNNPDGNGLNLVLAGTVGDLETAVRATSDVDLFHSVCKHAVLHAADDVDQAVMRRGQAIDRLLDRSKLPPAMLPLTGEAALRAGTEFIALLAYQVGEDEAMKLLSSDKKLEPAVLRCLRRAAASNPQLELHDEIENWEVSDEPND